MRIIYTTYAKIKGSPNIDSDKYRINHLLDENNPDKAICGFNHSESCNINGVYEEPENMLVKITCKKCLKKLNTKPINI